MLRTSLITIIALILGIVIGRFIKPTPSQILTKTETHTEIAQKTEVQVQATAQKDLTTGLKTNYTEKFFNNKGILIHSIQKGNVVNTNITEADNKQSLIVNNSVMNSDTKSMSLTTYASSLYLGLNVPSSDIKNPSNIVSKPEEINFMVEYRPFNKVNFFFESNYKLASQIGFLIAVN